jgi:hypothetical protein
MAGSATLTTLPSSRAMLDPRIVASSVSRLTDAGDRRFAAVVEVEWLIGGHARAIAGQARVSNSPA